MSSEGSRTTTSSRLSQFGLYRSIDARTEEFLRLSRKRQIRQGCACAAVSSAITVTVVVVILLIYEYAIAVESSLVQRLRVKLNNDTNLTHDNPFADRLDRSHFGFDQDYFERMPLLVNAMQENSDAQPTMETAPLKTRARYLISNHTKPIPTTMDYRTTQIRRTSPRPFIYEYRSPTPTPFSKTYGSRSWIENYRNAQRLKNLQQVIKYLEKTINAKFGDMYTLPTSTNIAFSGGVYVEPMTTDKVQPPKSTSPTIDLLLQSSNKIQTYKSNHNHQSDPLFSFKPDSPGEVNLLADGFLRFSPGPYQYGDRFTSGIPMFKPISHRHRNCMGSKCIDNYEAEILNLQASGEIKSTEQSAEKPKAFSVMLNLFPLKPIKMESHRTESMESAHTSANRIYITTTRPAVQFRRRSTTSFRPTITRFKRPRLLQQKKTYNSLNSKEDKDVESKVIVHLNVFPTTEIKHQDQSTTDTQTQSTTTQMIHRYATEMPILTSTQVEDYHVGSSGIIPIESRLTPAPPPPMSTHPIMTSVTPFPDTTTSSSEINSRSTNPPDVLKFSHEDAKVPDHFTTAITMENRKDKQSEKTMIRRNFEILEDTKKKVDQNTTPLRRNSAYMEEKEEITNIMRDKKDKVEPRTLIVKLKNDYVTTTKETLEEETTSIRTYVPQINGHYRSVNQNSRNINSWLNGNSEESRKRRLEMSVTGFRKPAYVPYVEIKRNNTRNSGDDDI